MLLKFNWVFVFGKTSPKIAFTHIFQKPFKELFLPLVYGLICVLAEIRQTNSEQTVCWTFSQEQNEFAF